MLEIPFRLSAELRGPLLMDRTRLRRLTTMIPASISISNGPTAGRRAVEGFIEERYASCYGSLISKHYPTLMSVEDKDGRVAAAVGLRLANEEPLFLERYLAEPVELALSAGFGRVVPRAGVVEIGSLVSAGHGASIFLFVTLAAYLRQQMLNYAVVTATETLRRLFARLGIAAVELGQAASSALPDNGASWGTYYETNPKVIAGATAPGFAALEPYLPLYQNDGLDHLFSGVGSKGTETRGARCPNF